MGTRRSQAVQDILDGSIVEAKEAPKRTRRIKAVISPDERTTIEPKEKTDWMWLVEKMARQHWRRLAIKIKVRGWLLAGKPAQLDAASAMIRARGLEDVLEAKMEAITDPVEREQMAQRVTNEGLCEFWRRSIPGLWFPSNSIKAGLKENWGVLGYRVKERGSRGALAEAVFVSALRSDTLGRDWPREKTEGLDWIYLGPSDPPPPIHTAVAHTMGPMGPCSSIKRHEYIVSPTLRFEVAIARAIENKLSDEGLADTLHHYGEHGLGACRSQGYGKFDLISIEEIDE